MCENLSAPKLQQLCREPPHPRNFAGLPSTIAKPNTSGHIRFNIGLSDGCASVRLQPLVRRGELDGGHKQQAFEAETSPGWNWATQLFRSRAVCPGGVVTVVVRYCSTGAEFAWKDCAIDWICEGLRRMAVREGGYDALTTRIMRVKKFDAGAPHVVVFLHLGNSQMKNRDVKSTLIANGSDDGVGWWDPARAKLPTKTLKPLNGVAKLIVNDLVKIFRAPTLFLVEPGGHFILPLILEWQKQQQVVQHSSSPTKGSPAKPEAGQRMPSSLYVCTEGDVLQEQDLRRRYSHVEKSVSDFDTASIEATTNRVVDAVLLICFLSPERLWQRWEGPIRVWLQHRQSTFAFKRAPFHCHALLTFVVTYPHRKAELLVSFRIALLVCNL